MIVAWLLVFVCVWGGLVGCRPGARPPNRAYDVAMIEVSPHWARRTHRTHPHPHSLTLTYALQAAIDAEAARIHAIEQEKERKRRAEEERKRREAEEAERR